ncbi:3',5'-cyclic-nucleotide phosphodiesterase [Halomonas sp. MCCC 1A11036]|uniref:3',5'-cyclic-nucleotide phosphodiesterase n=1 Tax=Billgrantia zhangzhouensis TaxID=2733481 RepID=A0ABS9AKZ0_9GAMM|nr:3',5'-cyclic-nucleotide phosphodiesterase [Halomonas zhangzhouensis]MCE8022412.1 3',5'-cyclic-nucleotide phosphodiesterase [Halomonas zhangzhouensis]
MKINVLGASGGLGDGSATTAILVGETVLLDAGTGLTHLSVDDAAAIQHVFLSHAHLDHVVGLPLLVDTLFERLSDTRRSLTVHALPAVIDILKKHLFNQHLWPDFSTLPTRNRAVMRLSPLTPGHTIVCQDRQPMNVTPFLVTHRVPACGFHVESPDTRFVFSGDTTLDASMLSRLNALGQIDILMLECAFPNHHHRLAESSGHMTPALVAELLRRLNQAPAQIWISHLKPEYRQQVIAELEAALYGQRWLCL